MSGGENGPHLDFGKLQLSPDCQVPLKIATLVKVLYQYRSWSFGAHWRFVFGVLVATTCGLQEGDHAGTVGS